MGIGFRIVATCAGLACLGAVGYGGKGFVDALRAGDALQERAAALITQGRGAADLGADGALSRRAQLLMVQDPGFDAHGGVDFTTAGAGATTLTQSLAKRLAFVQFKPGLRKIRQTGYALGLDLALEKDDILALWLDSVEIGRGPQGWVTGFFAASEALYQKPPSALSQDRFLGLVAVLIAPSMFDLTKDDAELAERQARIARLVAGQCAPQGHRDVWLEGCR